MNAPLSTERVRVLQRLLEIDPDDVDARRQLEELKQERERVREIGRLLRDADACLKYKLPERAAALFESVLELDPHHAHARAELLAIRAAASARNDATLRMPRGDDTVPVTPQGI